MLLLIPSNLLNAVNHWFYSFEWRVLLLDSEKAFISSNEFTPVDLINGQEPHYTWMHPIIDTEPLGSNLRQLTETFVQIILARLSSHGSFNAFKEITL